MAPAIALVFVRACVCVCIVTQMYYSWLLSADVNMYDETHDLTASAVNTSIAETLGQVSQGMGPSVCCPCERRDRWEELDDEGWWCGAGVCVCFGRECALGVSVSVHLVLTCLCARWSMC